MNNSKKVKVDMNPKKVKNPAENHKRNPGKFDQKVYMEQENFSSHAIKEMARIHAMQVHSVATKYDKDVLSMKKKQRLLEHKNMSYVYLKQLRQAFNDENERRESLTKRLEEFTRRQEEPTPEPIGESEDEVGEAVTYYKPWENVKPKQVQTRQNTFIADEHRPKTNFVQIHGNTGLQSMPVDAQHLESNVVDTTPHLPPIADRVATAEKAKLENMSRDIITATLPVSKLRRIIPPETKSSNHSYPIMSYYRKTTILPEVKKFKKRMSSDTSHLHSKINQYFGTHLPLSSYTIPESAKPHKLRLLKAISHDDFRLPQIPPEFK